jgi:Ribbon-helix-helix protein, copG family
LHYNALQEVDVADQLTIRLSPELGRALRKASRRMQRKRSDIVRIALSAYLGAPSGNGRPVDAVRSLIGSLESGVPDLAEKHRTYIIQSLRRGR